MLSTFLRVWKFSKWNITGVGNESWRWNRNSPRQTGWEKTNLTPFSTSQPSFAFPATSMESEIAKYLLTSLLPRIATWHSSGQWSVKRTLLVFLERLLLSWCCPFLTWLQMWYMGLQQSLATIKATLNEPASCLDFIEPQNQPVSAATHLQTSCCVRKNKSLFVLATVGQVFCYLQLKHTQYKAEV